MAFSFPLVEGLGGSGGFHFVGSCLLHSASIEAIDSSTVGSLNQGGALLLLLGFLLGLVIQIGSDTSLGEGAL